MTKRALISVSNKENLIGFAKKLIKLNYELISTGGTGKVLQKAGIKFTKIKEITGFPEMLDGRIKTLHPNIFGGILAQKDNPKHIEEIKSKKIKPIDLIDVNFYPFKQTIEKPNSTEKEVINKIDIGGPSMLRAAAKNFKSVLPVIDPKDYDLIIEALKNHKDDYKFRKKLAIKIFSWTASYDALIAKHFSSEEFPRKLVLPYEKLQELRYGENSHQKAAFYQKEKKSNLSIIGKQLHGKKLSFNNIKDANAALNMVAEFNEPAVIAMKHMSPCGVGIAKNLSIAWNEAYASDSMSIFGGIIAVNREVDTDTAKKMHKIFLEIVIAPSFSKEALTILEKKKNIRLLKIDLTQKNKPDKFETISVSGGLLMQETDHQVDKIKDFKVVTKKQPTQSQLKALQFGQHVVKFVKSNAIVVATGHKTLGVGAGQPNRIDSAKIAIKKAMPKDGYEKAILASDAFFPMPDCVEYAAKHDIKAIIQPGGSIRDQDSINMANKFGISMVMTGTRHFRH